MNSTQEDPVAIVSALKVDAERLAMGEPVSACAKSISRNKTLPLIAPLLFPPTPDPDRVLTPEYEQDMKAWSRIQCKRLIQTLSRQWDRQQPKPSPRQRPTTLEHKDFCVLKKRPVSEEVKTPLPMPVKMEKPSRFVKTFEALQKMAPHHPDAWYSIVQNSTLPAQSNTTSFGTQEFLDFSNMAVYNDNRIDLCKCGVGPKNIDALMSALEHNQYFQHFLFGNNVSGLEGAQAIAEYVKSHLGRGQFQTWYLAGNDLNAQAIHILCEAWTMSEALKALWLKRNPIHVEGARSLGQLLATHRSLEILDLDNCGLLDEGVDALCAGLTLNTTLRHLYLGANGIGPAGAEYLGRLLANDGCPLESLFLSTNRIGDEGAVHLAIALRKNQSLQRLILSSNTIESLGITALANAIAHHPTLRTVCFGVYASTEDMGELPNRMGVVGAFAIADMLRGNPRLQVLSVAHNALDAAQMNLIAQAASEHPTLLHLDLIEHKTKYDPEIRKSLYRHLLQNIRQIYGDDMSHQSFLRYHLHRHRNIPQVAHIRSIYRTADFQRQRRRQLEKRWPENKIDLIDKDQESA